ncbi:hypothetical protein [Embleya sp. NBC_00896]|uniref:hypothetical protein n=1 Tax=Embleya sp. NBC_00896 TaxID=2975961 RepID=UPI002F908F1B|nr:hypothetical protein OG928_33590 [Embleya sp. NBC_00896]
MSNGKVSLADGDSQVGFLITVPDEAAHAALDLILDFAVLELEFGITPEIEGYDRSDWLSFVTPIGSGSPPALDFDLGAPRVPIPLRAYPPMPILLDHHALVPGPAARLDEALHWQYRLSVQHQSAEQDTVELRVSYNQSPSSTAAAPDDDLFTALAQYTAVSAPLLGLLAGLPDWEQAGTDRRTALTNALGTYRTLASAVAQAWTTHWGQGPATAPAVPAIAGGGPVPEAIHRYTLGLDAEDGWYATLRLTHTVESGPDDVGLPEIVCVTEAGDRYDLTPVDPESCGCTDTDHCQCYAFPFQTVEAFTLLTCELTFPPVHVAAYQNASANARVTRNARLLGAGRPDTAPAFVYRTPTVGYREPVVPFIDITGAIPIDPWSNEPLAPMFAAVFDGDPTDRTIAIGARYEYTLVPAEPPVTALLPVVQSTVGLYDSTTIPTLTSALDGWSTRERPATTDGAWAFRLSLYSSLDSALRRPILQLKCLSSSLTSVGRRPDEPGPS